MNTDNGNSEPFFTAEDAEDGDCEEGKIRSCSLVFYTKHKAFYFLSCFSLCVA